MIKKTKSNLYLVIPFIINTFSAQAASFDCNKAKSPIEHSICANDELSNLDFKMAQSYQKALKSINDQDALKANQKSWLNHQRDKCSDMNCLIETYRQRFEALNNISFAASDEHQVTYLNDAKINLSYGGVNEIIDLGGYMNGCLGNLYDRSSNECISAVPSVEIVAISKQAKLTTMLLFVVTTPNCNIQSQCGAGINADLISLSVTDKLKKFYLDSFSLEDCFTGRSSKYKEAFYNDYAKNMSTLFKTMGTQIKIEFSDSEQSKLMTFDMNQPTKGFIITPTVHRMP